MKMIPSIPFYISLIFSITVIASVYGLYKASSNQKKVVVLLGAWIALQSVIGISGFYTNTMSLPPRFLIAVIPPLLFILFLFLLPNGRIWLDQLSPKLLTIIHVVRIPVEFVLFGLFIYKAIPQVMTFEGRNFDILAGITSPLVYYFGYHQNKVSKQIILLWNMLSLILLLNIVVTAVLSAPLPIQQMAFDQPNKAVMYFPYVLLPACVVPIVLFAHLVCIRSLFRDLHH
jgi:hypothetical protein